MKQGAVYERAQRAMRPGAITRDGLLGDDRRALAEILDADASAVQRLGLSHAVLAARMRELRAAGARGLGAPVEVPPHLEVATDGVRGRLACPFGDGSAGKTETRVTNCATGGSITFSDLSIHLVAAHGFYGGAGSPYRLDPPHLAATIEPATT